MNSLTPEQKARLDESAREVERKLLEEIGVASVEEAQEKLALFRAITAERASQQEATDERVAKLEARAVRLPALEATLANLAASKLRPLTEAQRAAITKLAGDDPVRLLETIDDLRAAGMLGNAPTKGM